jgi:hypothetical protein
MDFVSHSPLHILHIVMCRLWLEALGRAKPGQKKPSQAGPKLWLMMAFGLAQVLVKPKPRAQAPAFFEYKAEYKI